MTDPAAIIAAGLDLLRAEAARTSIGAAAKRIGYARSAVSMALAGTYGAGLGRLADAAHRALGGVDCPHLGERIDAAACRDHRERAPPTASRAAYRHWRACQRCPLNPTAPGGEYPC